MQKTRGSPWGTGFEREVCQEEPLAPDQRGGEGQMHSASQAGKAFPAIAGILCAQGPMLPCATETRCYSLVSAVRVSSFRSHRTPYAAL